MSALEIVALVIGLTVTVVGWAMLARAVRHFVSTFKLGQPDSSRTDRPAVRTTTLFREFLGHTRMARLPVVAIAHWVTMLSFGILFLTLVQATFQLADPHFVLPLIGHFWPYEWVTELFAVGGLVGIVALIAIRQKNHPRLAAGEDGRRSRFYGSTFWQAYYVEATILGVALCITLLRGLEYALLRSTGEAEQATLLHFPLTAWLGAIFGGLSVGALEAAIVVVALVKLLISYAWMITVSLNPTMGVAWHRFLAFFNIYFKRHADGATSLGALQPMTVGGKPFSMEVMEEMEETEDEISLGVGKVEDFTWKGLLDFSTCTECGRCQSQCPAWNTDKPLSPKMLMMTLRDHAHAKAPFVAAARDVSGIISSGSASPQTAKGAIPASAFATGPDETATDGGSVATATAIDWDAMSLVGQTGYDVDNPLSAYNPHGPDAVIDEDVLWSCTTCGACVEQCPVDIEHVDHIVDMRRYQNLIESAFPSELGGLFKKLESKGNPWGMGAKARMDWAKDLPFTVKVLGEDVESADEVDYLFWVGCAGAYEDRAKKTTRAVAELFDIAGVDFAVLGNGETCTGDSARRAGNEVLFQMLAEQNVATLDEVGATKIVVTCAHCFNTIKNEYPQLGGTYEVLHHTQLLNRLVREKKLAPVRRPSAPEKSSLKNVASTGTSVTYHDPCYLGRHNQVYAPPRELIGALPGVELREMERTKEKSFCCGAGGARMWMEEQLGSRINLNRTEEAIATGAERIAVGCPFCRVMLSDGLTAKQSEGASEDIEVVDIAQMLLASVREAPETTGTTESQEQAQAEPKTAVPAPQDGQDAKGATPEPPSAAETAATAAAVKEAGEDPEAVEGRETVADQNSAPSWESEGAASANAAPSWESETPQAAPAETKEEPATAPSDAAAANAAPSWESEGAASANAAPSWESETPQAAPAEAKEEPATAPSDAAAANAAPSWESEGAASANAAPSWESETPQAAPTEAKDEPATAPSDAAAANAAPSWESETPQAAPTEAKDEPATAQSDAAAANAAPSWESKTPQAAPAEAKDEPATAPSDAAAANAAPSWESKTPQAAPAEAKDEPATAPSDAAAANAAPSWESKTPQAAPAEAKDEPATAPSDAAAANAAPSWESKTPQAAPAEAKDEPATAPSDAAAANAAPSWESKTPQAAPAEAKDEPATAPSDAAAANAAPSWETSSPAPTGGGEPESPAAGEATEPEVGGQETVTGSEEPTQGEVTPTEPAADTPSPAEPAATATPEDADLDDLRQQNAKPSWE
ncbi:heterodisulfide reductase-related iron-sulfur binding cluster [Janibacter melonis]|uniref:heterodisulfide reductase-related iron-sulfur binding cluster n=1 Tax=Janibacter melonis TaxID=262209 RepID=UPI002095BB8E|nr:heterodisulfide reductase-related iron-sulfur binding cluster [Janibacter melonis]